MKKSKCYADGGTVNPQAPTYPFGVSNQYGATTGTTQPINQTFNMAPSTQTDQSQQAGYKKGGKIKSASSRADGCAIRGKTRA
jgi:hypothetical protein